MSRLKIRGIKTNVEVPCTGCAWSLWEILQEIKMKTLVWMTQNLTGLKTKLFNFYWTKHFGRFHKRLKWRYISRRIKIWLGWKLSSSIFTEQKIWEVFTRDKNKDMYLDNPKFDWVENWARQCLLNETFCFLMTRKNISRSLIQSTFFYSLFSLD